MSIYVSEETRVVVQGITGNEGSFHTRQMLHFGTNIVAGMTPGKGGQQVEGVPVFDRVADAVVKHGANTSIVFVPARSAGSAVAEAIEAGIKTIIVITESIPLKDSIELFFMAQKAGTTIIGPNTAGILSPTAHISVGIMPGHIFRPGNTGIVSRSGTLTYEIASQISNSGLGQSTCVGIGGDPMVGTDFVPVLERLGDDRETKAVVLIGEIGGNKEELAARYIQDTDYPKRVVAYIAGKAAPPEKKMGHAGAIIMGNTGTAKGKIEALKAAGAAVADKPSDVPRLLAG